MPTKRHKTERRLDSETIAMLNAQREAFRQKFGRDPGPDDPLFFDPEAPVPRPIDRTEVDEALLEALRRSGIAPSLIHAVMKTGLIISEENYERFSPEDLAAWHAALDEYDELQRRGQFG